MSLITFEPYIAQGPFLIYAVNTSEFPTSIFTPIQTQADGAFLIPNLSTYTSSKLLAYTEGDVSFSRTPNVNSYKFNEVTGTALQLYTDEDVTISLNSQTPFMPIGLDLIQGGFHTQNTGPTITTDYIYGGNTTTTSSIGLMLVAKQQGGYPLIICVPSVSLAGEFGIALQKGSIAQPGFEITALASAGRETWWIHKTYATPS